MLKQVFYIVFGLTLLWGNICHAESVLSDSDVVLYKQIFQAHRSGDFKKAQKLEGKLSNHLLDGYILYDRYFSPLYKTKKEDISAWFSHYADLAVATDMYELGKQKKATLPPQKPKGLFGGQSGTCSAVFRPEPIDLIRGKSFSYLSSKDAVTAKKL
ncbi:MAG: hypothetical protein IKS41_04305 [Alphaproteobacteria bacterium]|nr:hypothetical protein [Alphaproteobacteria bacterium]